MLEKLFTLEHTYTLLQAIEKVDPPASFLADTFFPNKITTENDTVAVEYKKSRRDLAPYITKNTRGVGVARSKSQIRYYSPVMFAPRRTIGLYDLQLRQFGERPDIYHAVKPEERFAQMQAQDLAEMLRMHANRREQMASEILQTGKIVMKAYADDGAIIDEDTIEFEGQNTITPPILWSDPAAKIYKELYDISTLIQEQTGQIPTLAICGKNVESYLLKNEEIREWLMVPNRMNLTMANMEPRWTSPQIRQIGRISALNLDVVSYAMTYVDDDGTIKPFIDPDTLIIGIPGNGREIHAPVTIFQNGTWQTIAAPYVPKYSADENAETTSLTVYSRYILTPAEMNDWYVVRCNG